jgi:hypothetical protein
MGYKCFFKVLESNYWRDCPITTDDAKRALHIYGTDIVMLRGKATKEILDKMVLQNIMNNSRKWNYDMKKIGSTLEHELH